MSIKYLLVTNKYHSLADVPPCVPALSMGIESPRDAGRVERGVGVYMAPSKSPARRQRRTQAERSEESGQRMLEAGIQLLIERGPQKTTLKDVGERAGYSRGLASYRFGSKEGLFREILALGRRQWAHELESRVGDQQGLPALLGAMDAFRHFLRNAPDNYRAMLILWYDSIGHPSPVTAKLKEHQEAQRRDVRVWVEQGMAAGDIDAAVDPDAFAATFCALVYGTAYQWQVKPDAFDLDDLFEAYQQWLERMLRPRSA